MFRKLEEKNSKIKDILNQYTSWKSLPVKDALEAYSSIQSQLSSISALCSVEVESLQSRQSQKITFEMCAPSEILSFARLGRIMMEKERKEDPIGTGLVDAVKSQDFFGEPPPCKKKKKEMK